MGQNPAFDENQEKGGLTTYYQSKIDELEMVVREKNQNLRRLQAQRNELNSKGTLIRESERSVVSEFIYSSFITGRITTASGTRILRWRGC